MSIFFEMSNNSWTLECVQSMHKIIVQAMWIHPRNLLRNFLLRNVGAPKQIYSANCIM